MSKVCLQCDKKIGFFKHAVDGVYCSETCRDAGLRAIAENERRAAEQQIAAERARKEAEEQAVASARAAELEQKLRATCPKCGAAWSVKLGAGAAGLHAGHCDKCGLTVEFKEIEQCPTCTGMSLVVEALGARCPRCKFRQSVHP